jgi:hypothetical protein
MKTIHLLLRLLLLGFTFFGVQIGNIALAESLSGTYQIHYREISRSCGRVIQQPLDIKLGLEFSSDRVRLSPSTYIWGFSLPEVDFDKQTGEFQKREQTRVDLGATKATLTLAINGRVSAQSKEPHIEFDLLFDKNADDPSWNCKITGWGWGERT